MIQLFCIVSIAFGCMSSDSTDVASVVKRFHAALETADSATAVQLLHPDVVIIEAGSVERLDEYRSHHLPADIEFGQTIKSEQSALHVSVDGKMAWAWSTSSTKGSFKGRAVDSLGAEMMTLVKTSQGWRIVGIHWSSRRRPSPSQ